MAINVISTSTNVSVLANTAGDTYLVLPDVFVTTAVDAIDGDDVNGSKSIIVHGHLIAEQEAISLGVPGDTGSGNNEVHILPGASLFAEDIGVFSFGGRLLLVNEGSIFARNDGLNIDGNNNVVYNYGTIAAGDEGIEISGTNNLVVNLGSVMTTGNGEAVELDTTTGETATLINFGFLGSDVDGDSGDDRIVNRGDIEGNILLGAGNDEFDGRGGYVEGSVNGGSGDDLFLIDDASVDIVENSGAGTDTVGSEVTFALPDNVENLVLLGDGDINGFGNDLNNTIAANAGRNFIDGGAGIDTVSYGSGQAGIVAQLFGTVDAGSINPGSLGGFTLPIARSAGTGGAEGDILLNVENMFGTDAADIMLGSSGANVLRGRGGADTLFGNAGDDVLEGGAGADALNGGSGTDFASYSTATLGLTVDMIILADNTEDAVGDVFSNIQNLRGSQFNDMLSGTFATNLIQGLDGNDSLRGRGGGDTYQGGAGDDTFVYQNGFGAERILDFEALNDNEKVDFSQVTAITDFTDLFNNHLTTSGSHSLITVGASTITLVGVAVSDLDANDFIF